MLNVINYKYTELAQIEIDIKALLENTKPN